MGYKNIEVRVTAERLNEHLWQKSFIEMLQRWDNAGLSVKAHADDIRASRRGISCGMVVLQGVGHAAVAILDEFCMRLSDVCGEVTIDLDEAPYAIFEEILKLAQSLNDPDRIQIGCGALQVGKTGGTVRDIELIVKGGAIEHVSRFAQLMCRAFPDNPA